MELNQIYNTGYEAFLVGFTAVLLAQIIKFFSNLFVKRTIDMRYLITTGGMPSSHAAGVMSMTTSVGIITGFDSMLFAVSLGFSLIVMYDAAGVRRAAGKQAVCLNKIIMDVYKQELKEAGGKLKELLGHTPLQVFIGALLGILYSYYIHTVLVSKLG